MDKWMIQTLFPHWSLFWVFYFLPFICQFPTFSLQWKSTKNPQAEKIRFISPHISSPAQSISTLPSQIQFPPQEDMALDKVKEKLLAIQPKQWGQAKRVNKLKFKSGALGLSLVADSATAELLPDGQGSSRPGQDRDQLAGRGTQAVRWEGMGRQGWEREWGKSIQEKITSSDCTIIAKINLITKLWARSQFLNL